MKIKCRHCQYYYAKIGNLCKVCYSFPKCLACRIILDNVPNIDNVCDLCYGFENLVKHECSCGEIFQNSPKRYLTKGNFCDDCVSDVNELFPKDGR